MNDTLIDNYNDDDNHKLLHHHHPNGTLPPSHLLVPEYVDSPYKTALFFLFGLCMLFLFFYLARCFELQRRREQEAVVERQRQREVDVEKAKERLRNRLIQSMNKKKLSMTLTSSNIIQTVASSAEVDIEKGVPGEGRDDTLPGIPEDGSVDDITEQKSTDASCDKDVAGEPLPNNDIELRVDKTEDDEIKQQKSSLSTDDITKVPDLDLETVEVVKIADGLEDTGFEDAAPETEATGGVASEIVVTRKGSAVSFRNECAICLDCYTEGDTVVWSGNVSCQHVFHQQCILDYLVQKMDEEGPCPCCRQVFLPKDRWKPNIKASGQSEQQTPAVQTI